MLEFLSLAKQGELHPFTDIIRPPQGDEDLAAFHFDHIPFDFGEEIGHFRRQALERTAELALGLDRYPSSHDEGCQCSQMEPSQSPHSHVSPAPSALSAHQVIIRISASVVP